MLKVLSLFAFVFLPAVLVAQPAPRQIVSELAPTGRLNASINYGNALLAQRDPKTGEPSGVSVDLAQELARRLGVPVKLVLYDSAGRVTDAVKTGAWDVAFLAVDPVRAVDIDFSPPYLKLEGTYLVPAGSPLHSVEDVDREGIRIAVSRGSAYDLYLTRNLKHAQLVRAEKTDAALDVFLAQHLEVVAGIRTALVMGKQRVPGATVFSGAFMAIPQAVAIPKGHPSAAEYVRKFVQEMIASGFVAQSLKQHGLENDAEVVKP